MNNIHYKHIVIREAHFKIKATHVNQSFNCFITSLITVRYYLVNVNGYVLVDLISFIFNLEKGLLLRAINLIACKAKSQLFKFRHDQQVFTQHEASSSTHLSHSKTCWQTDINWLNYEQFEPNKNLFGLSNCLQARRPKLHTLHSLCSYLNLIFLKKSQCAITKHTLNFAACTCLLL